MNDLLTLSIGIIGCVFIWRKHSRQFSRTNEYGQECFPTYLAKVKARLINEFLGFSGIGLITGSVLIFAFKYATEWVWLLVILLIAFAGEELFFRDRRKMSHVKIVRH